MQAIRHLQPGTIIVMPLINDSSHHFSISDFDLLDHELIIELERVHVGMLETEMRTVFAHVSETGESYIHFTHMTFHHGGVWRDEDSIIISEELAWELFGNLDVVGLPLRLNGVLYTISGVTKHSGNFAWVLRNATESQASIMYISREPYNWILAHASILELLESLNRRAENYTITSINFYLRSIELRSLVLIFLTLSIFLVISIRYAMQLPRYQEQIIAIVIIVGLFAWSAGRLDIDLWIPAHAGNGWEAYLQLFFNTGMFAARQYLPGNLAELYDLNFRAGLAFGLGILGIFGTLVKVMGAFHDTDNNRP